MEVLSVAHETHEGFPLFTTSFSHRDVFYRAALAPVIYEDIDGPDFTGFFQVLVQSDLGTATFQLSKNRSTGELRIENKSYGTSRHPPEVFEKLIEAIEKANLLHG